MTLYEWLRWFSFPIMTVHLKTVRADVKTLITSSQEKKKRLSILDVGGRKSPYTIGLNADVTLLDVPQENSLQDTLNLGFTKEILKTIKRRRSNITKLVIEDMTQSQLVSETFDAVICVEVIEHVVQDEAFVKQIYRVLKPGGWAYFTTPNGDYIKNEGPDKNPDHVKHYTKAALEQLLGKHFRTVEVYYAVATGKYRVMGLKGFTVKRPLSLFKTITANFINTFQSKKVSNRAFKTAHLVAIVHK